MMIKLADGCYISADHIAEVKVHSDSDTITVRTKNGIGHCHFPNRGESVYAASERLIAEINAALQPPSRA